MSTKTTFKRIALVTVAALGFGVLSSVAPATAADTTASTFTSSLSLNTTSITSVGALDTTGSAEKYNAAVFKITANGNGGSSAELFADESITASVSAVPTSVFSTYTMGANSADLELSFVSGTGYGAAFTTTGTVADGTTVKTALVDTSATSSVDQARLVGGGALATTNGVYFLAVTPGNGKTAAMDSGYYTIRIRLQDTSGFITNYSVKVQFVTSAADSGAVIVPTITGTVFAGDAITYTTTKNMKATLRDANNGLIQGVGSAAYTPTIPTVTADIMNLTTGLAKGTTNTATIADSGADAVDHVAITTDGTVSVAATRETANVINLKGDGTYGITTGVLTAAAADGDSLRVRYGATSASAALTITAAATASTVGVGSFTATGKIAGATANAVTLPLTTKSVTFNNLVTLTSVAQTGYNTYYTLAYGASCVLADMSPTKSATPVKLATDSTGVAALVVTNANPLNACTASVVWSGAATNPGVTSGDTQVATWAAPAATTSLASVGSYQAKLASTNTVSWTITDQFGAVVVGKTVQFDIAGANEATPATAVTDANGQVSLTWTDAAAVNADTDTVTITAVGADTPTTGSVTVTYKTALQAVANIQATYGSTATLVPTTNIGGTDGIAVSTADQLDLTASFTSTYTAAPWVRLKFLARTSANATVSGVPTTVTVSGAQLVTTTGKLGTSKVVYDNGYIYVLGTTAGVATVTATNGTVTSKATILFVNDNDLDERVVSATESNGIVTVSVKDAFGNAVSGSTLDVTASGGAVLGSSTFGSYKTSTDGTVSFSVTGAGTVTAKLATAYKTGYLAASGNATGTVSTPGAPAGVRSASVTTKGITDAATAAATAATAAAVAATAAATAASAAAAKAGADAVAASAAAQAAAVAAAEAAADAAAEATDAANAATDAANASAEAGDAATAAAQDAADAVAALSTQVSEMISALKAQLTALTNLVIKIQKKVKA